MLIPDEFPSFLGWMADSDKIRIWTRDEAECRTLISSAELIFSLDYNDLRSLKEAGEVILNAPAIRILLDHHLYPTDQYTYRIAISATSSTAELVYDFIVESGDRDLIDREMAEALYTGIITDTGSFSYSCNRVETYETVAALFRVGLDGEHIHRLIYDTYSEHRLRLLGFSLSEKLTVHPEYHTAFIALTGDELDRFYYQIGDTEGVVNYALSIDGINLAALFTEGDQSIRISFRSKGHFSVEKFARTHFDGGGHPNASGATSYLTMEETVRKFIDLLPGYREALANVYER